MTTDLNEEISLKELKVRLANNPGIILESLLDRYQVTMAQILESLPEQMRSKIDGSHFIDVLTKVSAMGSVVVIIHVSGQIFEFKGDFPQGELGHGFYNLKGNGSGLHGHLRPEKCKSIYFVERPFMKKDTASIQFMDHDGATMF
ncbi:MAG: heme utilization cystosolic carrier protein HutX, partial [Saezia sp.]